MEPVVVQIRHRKAMILGSFFGLFAVLWLGLCMATFSLEDAGLSWPIALGMLVGVFFAAFAALNIGIALKKPVALRMDANGISGFYADPATWREIREIGVFTGPKGHKFLGFRLHDPIAFRDRQTPMRRLQSWSNGRGKGFHIVVPEILLRDTSVNDLVLQARAFHQRSV